MGSARILVIEDDPKIAETVKLYLEHAGYEVAHAADGETGLQRGLTGGFDLLVLDLMLPRLDGTDLCRKLRVTSDVPIIMLTAKTTEDQKIRGLRLGADDYVAKPFSPRELVARVEAVLRRRQAPGQEPGRLRRGGLVIEPARRRVTVDGAEVELTPTEFDLLLVLASRAARVFRRQELIERVLGYDFAGSDRTIDAHIKNLRRKIEPDRACPLYIETVFGVGYRFAEP